MNAYSIGLSRMLTYMPVLVSLVALGMLLGNVALIIWGPCPKGLARPSDRNSSTWARSAYRIRIYSSLRLPSSYLLFKHSSSGATVGKVLRAVAQDKTTASLMGIESDRAVALTFAYSSVLGGIAGMLVAPLFVIETGLAAMGFKGFGACVVGSFGNILAPLQAAWY